LRSEILYLQNKVIAPVQNLFIQNVVQPFLNYIAEDDANFKDIYLEFSNSIPISFVGDIDVTKVLTQDEQREVLGFKPLESNQINDIPNA